MKKIIIISLLIVLILFCGIASASSMNGVTVTNTNIYAPSSQNDIAPSGYSGTGNTVTGITHTSELYLSISGATVSPATGTQDDTFTLQPTGQKGATVFYDSTNGVYVGTVTDSVGTYYLKNFDELRHDRDGTFTPQVIFKNPQQTLSSITASSYTVQSVQPPTISAITSPTNPTPINTPLTSTVTATPYTTGGHLTYVWQVNTGSSWSDIAGQTTATLSYTPATVGNYQFRVIVSETETGLSATSDTVSTTAITTPTIGDLTISQAIGKLSTAYTVTLTLPVTDKGGSTPTYTAYEGSTQIGTGQVTGNSVSITRSINDNTATTHEYKITVGYGDVIATSNTVTFSTYARPTALTPVVNPTSISVSTAATVLLSATSVPTAPADNPYTYTWTYGTTGTVIGTWTDTSQPYTWNIPASLFTTARNVPIYVTVTDSLGQAAESSPQPLTIVATAPVLSTPTVSASKGTLTSTVTVSSSLTSTGGSTVSWKLQEQIGGSWTDKATGTASATGTISQAVSIADTVSTTHTYRFTATSGSGLFISPETVTAAVTYQTYAPPDITGASITANPSSIIVSRDTAVTLSGTGLPTPPTGNPYTYSWKVDGTQVGTTVPYVWTARYESTGTHSVSLTITDSLGQTVTIPAITVTVSSITANFDWNGEGHGFTDQFTLSISGSTPGMTYQWYSHQTAPTAGEDVIITGATSETYVTSMQQLGLAAGHTYYFKAIVTSASGTVEIITQQVTAYADPVPNAPTASASSVSVPGSVTLTASSQDELQVETYNWQKQSGGSWTNIGAGTTYTAEINSEGQHVFRFVAVGKNGNAIPSTSVTITAGYPPTVSIVLPENGQRFTTKGQIQLVGQATGEGNSYEWTVEDSAGMTHGDLHSLNSWVKYTYSGDKIIMLTATNQYGSDTAQIIINYYDPTVRPMATVTLAPVPTVAINEMMNVVDVAPGSFPSIKDTVKAVMAPVEEVMPTGLVFVLVFGVIFIMLWLITKNTAVPAIIGVIFGAFLLAFFPASYYAPAIAILAISITGGIYRVFRPPQ